MATLLERYVQIKNSFAQKMAEGTLPVEKTLEYQETLYRINVLETCQLFCKTAPVTMDTKVLSLHYQLVEAVMYCMITDHKIGSQPSDELKVKRETAKNSLKQVIYGFQKQFSSFKPVTVELYSTSISNMIAAIIPAWIQYRDTYTNLKEEV